MTDSFLAGRSQAFRQGLLYHRIAQEPSFYREIAFHFQDCKQDPERTYRTPLVFSL